MEQVATSTMLHASETLCASTLYCCCSRGGPKFFEIVSHFTLLLKNLHGLVLKSRNSASLFSTLKNIQRCFYYRTIAIWASILTHVNACLFFKLSCLNPVHCTSSNWMSKPELNLRAKYSEVTLFLLHLISNLIDARIILS